jgi:hypothetical protein
MSDGSEEDDLPVPAGSIRVVIGLILMTVGSFTGLVSARPWLSFLGWAAFIVSFLIMLKTRN